MNNNNIETVSVEFASKGIKALESGIIQLNKKLAELSQVAEKSGVDLDSVFDSKASLKISKLYNQLITLKKTLASAGGNTVNSGVMTEITTINNKVVGFAQQISGSLNLIKGTTKGASENIKSVIKSLSGLGVSADVIANLNTKYKETQKLFKETGINSSILNLNRDVSSVYTNLSKVNELQQKLQNTKYLSKGQTTSFTRDSSNVIDKISTGKLSNKQAVEEVNRLTASYKTLENVEKSTISLKNKILTDNLKNLEVLKSQKTEISTLLSKSRENLDSGSLNTVSNYIKDLDSKITKLEAINRKIETYKTQKSLLNVQKNPDFDKYTNNLSFKDTKDTLAKGVTTNNSLYGVNQLTNSFKGFKEEFVNKLPEDIKVKYTSAFAVIGKQLTDLKSKITKGTDTPGDLQNYSRKIDLLKETVKYETDLYNLRKSGMLSSSDYNKSIKSLDEFKKGLVSSKYSATELKKTLDNIKSPQTLKLKLDSSFDKVIRDLSAAELSLSSKINSRKSWTTGDALSKANTELKEIKKRIEEARQAKEKFDSAFTKSPHLAVSQYSAVLQNQQSGVLDTRKNVMESNAGMAETSLGSRFGRIAGNTIMYSGVYKLMAGIVSIGGDAISTLLEFDNSVAMMTAILGDSSKSYEQNREEMVKTELALVGLKSTYGGAIDSINKAAISLARGGVKQEDLLKGTEVAMQMAKLTGDSYETSTDAIITWIHTYGSAAGILKAPENNIKALGNTLAYMANQTRGTTSDIATFSGYALEAAMTAGMTKEAVGSLYIAFANSGMSASTAGTTVRKFTQALNDSDPKIQNFFDKIGVNQGVLQKAIQQGGKESDKAISDFAQRLKRLSDEDYLSLVSGMEVHTKHALDSIRNTADVISGELTKMGKGLNGELDKAKTATDSLGTAWEKLIGHISLSFLRNSKGVLDTLRESLNAINKMYDEIENREALRQSNGGQTKQWSATDELPVGLGWVGDIVNTFTGVSGISASFSDLATSNEKLYNAIEENRKQLVSISAKGNLGDLSKQDVTKLIVDNIKNLGAYSTYVTNKEEKSSLGKTIGELSKVLTEINSGKEIKGQLNANVIQALADASFAGMNAVNTRNYNYMSEFTKVFAQVNKGKVYSQDTSGPLNRLGESATDCSAALVNTEAALNKLSKSEAMKLIGGTTTSQIQKAREIGTIKADYKQNYPVLTADLLKKLAIEVGDRIYIKQADGRNQHIVVYNGEDVKGNIKVTDFGNKGVHANRTFTEAYDSKLQKLMAIVSGKATEAFLSKNSTASINKVQTVALTKSTTEDIAKLQGYYIDKAASLPTNKQKVTGDLTTFLKDIATRESNTAKQSNVPKDKTDALGVESTVKNYIKNNELTSDSVDNLINSLRKASVDMDNLAKKRVEEYISGLEKPKQNLYEIEQKQQSNKDVIAKMTSRDELEFLFDESKIELLNIDKLLSQEKINAQEALKRGELYINKEAELNNKKIAVYEESIKKYSDKTTEIRAELDVEKAALIKMANTTDTSLRDKQAAKVDVLQNKLNKLEGASTTATNALLGLKEATSQANAALAEKYRKDITTPYNELINKDYSGGFAEEYRSQLSFLGDNSIQVEEQTKLLSKLIALIDRDNSSVGETGKSLKAISPSSIVSFTDPSEYNAYVDNMVNTFESAKGKIQGLINSLNEYSVEKYGVMLNDMNAVKKTADDLRLSGFGDSANELLLMHKTAEEKQTEITAIEAQKRNAIAESEFNKKLMTANLTFGALANIADAYYAISGKKSKAAFKVYQAMQVAQTIMSTYASAQEAYKSAASIPVVGAWLAPVMAAGAIAAGMAKVAAIKQQSYHTGGYVANDSRSNLRNDEVPAVLQTGEYVLSRNDMKNIKDAQNSSTHSPSTPAKNEVVIVNTLDTSVIEQYLTSRAGRQIIHNVIKR